MSLWCFHSLYFVRLPPSQYVLSARFVSTLSSWKDCDTAVISAFLFLSSSAFHLRALALARGEGCRVLSARLPIILQFFCKKLMTRVLGRCKGGYQCRGISVRRLVHCREIALSLPRSPSLSPAFERALSPWNERKKRERFSPLSVTLCRSEKYPYSAAVPWAQCRVGALSFVSGTAVRLELVDERWG